jgi:hypothetical protein
MHQHYSRAALVLTARVQRQHGEWVPDIVQPCIPIITCGDDNIRIARTRRELLDFPTVSKIPRRDLPAML